MHLPHPEILPALEPGHRLLIDDGKLQLSGHRGDGKRDRLHGRVAGNKISDRKGVSLPDTELPVSAR